MSERAALGCPALSRRPLQGPTLAPQTPVPVQAWWRAGVAAGPWGPARVSWEGAQPPVSVSWLRLSVVWRGKGQEMEGRREFRVGVPPPTSEPGRKLYGPEERRGWWWWWWWCVTEEQTGGSRTVQTVESGIPLAYRSRLGPARVRRRPSETRDGAGPRHWAPFISLYRGAGAKTPGLGLAPEAQVLPSLSHFPALLFLGRAPSSTKQPPLRFTRAQLALPSSPPHDSSPG